MYQMNSAAAISTISTYLGKSTKAQSFFVSGKNMFGCSVVQKKDGRFKTSVQDCNIPTLYICELIKIVRKLNFELSF